MDYMLQNTENGEGNYGSMFEMQSTCVFLLISTCFLMEHQCLFFIFMLLLANIYVKVNGMKPKEAIEKAKNVLMSFKKQ